MTERKHRKKAARKTTSKESVRRKAKQQPRNARGRWVKR